MAKRRRRRESSIGRSLAESEQADSVRHSEAVNVGGRWYRQPFVLVREIISLRKRLLRAIELMKEASRNHGVSISRALEAERNVEMVKEHLGEAEFKRIIRHIKSKRAQVERSKNKNTRMRRRGKGTDRW